MPPGHGARILTSDRDVVKCTLRLGEVCQHGRDGAHEHEPASTDLLLAEFVAPRDEFGKSCSRESSAESRAAVLDSELSTLGSSPGGADDPAAPRHLIYLHGRILQEQQSARPRHPRFGYYEMGAILAAFRDRGFVVSGEVRPKSATVDDSADRVVAQVRRLLDSGVPADHVTVVGGSMGAGIALVASSCSARASATVFSTVLCRNGSARS
jgi:hypothetical protein